MSRKDTMKMIRILSNRSEVVRLVIDLFTMQDNDASMVYKPCLDLPLHTFQVNLEEMLNHPLFV